MSKNVVVE